MFNYTISPRQQQEYRLQTERINTAVIGTLAYGNNVL